MKKILVKGQKDVKKGKKSMTIIQRSEDKDCRTCVRKSFDYDISKSSKLEPMRNSPEVYIKKTIDTKRGIEAFNFKVDGSFYMTQDRVVLKVEFHHVLSIRIRWKTKDFSPKKSETLT